MDGWFFVNWPRSTLYLVYFDFSSKRNLLFLYHWTLSSGLFSLQVNFASCPFDTIITSGTWAIAAVSLAVSSRWVLLRIFFATQVYLAMSAEQTFFMTRLAFLLSVWAYGKVILFKWIINWWKCTQNFYIPLSTSYLVNFDFSSTRNFPPLCHWILSNGAVSWQVSLQSCPSDATVASLVPFFVVIFKWVLFRKFKATQLYWATSSMHMFRITKVTVEPSEKGNNYWLSGSEKLIESFRLRQ